MLEAGPDSVPVPMLPGLRPLPFGEIIIWELMSIVPVLNDFIICIIFTAFVMQ
jgi:hypothetical protein